MSPGGSAGHDVAQAREGNEQNRGSSVRGIETRGSDRRPGPAAQSTTREADEATRRVEGWLAECQFPCAKREVVAAARRADAPPDALERFERLPDRSFRSAADVVKEWGQTR